MLDQVSRWERAKVPSIALTADTNKGIEHDIVHGKYTLLFCSPETILQSRWYSMLKTIRQKICLLAIDEAHCLTKWGDSFREDFRKIGRLRTILNDVPTLALTATATEDMVKEVAKILHLTSGELNVVGVVPDRPNITLELKALDSKSFEGALQWISELLKDHGTDAPKIIIYARTQREVYSIYGWLLHTQAERARGPEGHRLVEMFHGDTPPSVQSHILEQYIKLDSNIRVVVATIAFGMGVDVPDIRHVVHWGPSRDILSYWQEIGRCARDGNHGEAKMYIFPGSRNSRFVSEDFLGLLRECLGTKTCIRQSVLQFLKISGLDSVNSCAEGSCCSNCNA